MTSTLNHHKTALTQTMYNLHTKRTLPRDVIKWMQGLDLSYSVKDYRKDMSNGFLIAEIISRYQPGKIPMHAFENSNNQNKRDNNWNQLQLFFNKNTLKSIQILEEEYSNIKNNKDLKSQNLFNFICRLYSICTKRTVPQNAPMLDLPPTQNQNANLTTSYLLRDEGLQKLQNSGLQHSNASHNNSGLSQKNYDRVPTRKISPNIQTSNMVDATGVGIKAEGRKMTSKRKSWNYDQKQQSNHSEENATDDKLIFDYLHQIMQECLPTEDPSIKEILFPQHSKFNPTELLVKNLNSINQEYFKIFITQLNLSVENLIPIILREINETWKFFGYFLRTFRCFSDFNDEFIMICDVVSLYAKHCHEKEPKRLAKVFYDSLLSILISEVKIANYWKKKEKIMNLLYDFSGRDIEQKKNVLSKLKDQIGSNNSLYIHWLSILVKQQTDNSQVTDSKLLDDYIYYAQQYIPSSQTVARTSALKILYQISKKNYLLIEKYFTGKMNLFRNCRGDPQQVFLFIQIYFNIIKEVVNSKDYQSLVKGAGSNNLVKAYNPDNEKNAEQLRIKLNNLAQTIKVLSQNCANSSVRQLCAKRSILFISESKNMMLVFLEYVYNLPNKQHFFTSNNVIEHQFKSMVFQSSCVDIATLKEFSNEILVEIINLKNTQNYAIQEFLYLINISLENLNTKKINMEFWEDVSLHIVKIYASLLVQPDYYKQASNGIIKVFNICFNYDMKIRELSQWIFQSINFFYSNSAQIILQSQENGQQIIHSIQTGFEQINNWINTQYEKNRNEAIGFTINEICDGLKSKKVIYLKK